MTPQDQISRLASPNGVLGHRQNANPPHKPSLARRGISGLDQEGPHFLFKKLHALWYQSIISYLKLFKESNGSPGPQLHRMTCIREIDPKGKIMVKEPGARPAVPKYTLHSDVQWA
jgi:hypothetical protein